MKTPPFQSAVRIAVWLKELPLLQACVVGQVSIRRADRCLVEERVGPVARGREPVSIRRADRCLVEAGIR